MIPDPHQSAPDHHQSGDHRQRGYHIAIALCVGGILIAIWASLARPFDMPETLPITTLARQSPTVMSSAGIPDGITRLRPANHRQVPVVHSTGDRILWAWAGADGREARLYSATWQPDQAIVQGTILALKAYYPQDLSLTPIDANTYHLLWLDAESDGETLRLRSAVIGADGIAQVGALTLSDSATHDYAVLPVDDGRLLVAYTAGNIGDTALYTRILDRGGRPSFAQRQASDARDVALLRPPDQIIRVYWRDQGTLWQANYDTHLDTLSQNETLLDRRAWGDILPPEGGDLISLRLALQGDYLLGFVEVYDADGMMQLWWASAPYEQATFTDFQPLAITTTGEPFASGYNGGQAVRITPQAISEANGQPVCAIRWLGIPATSEAILPTAIECDDTLGVLFWQDGTPAGYLPWIQDAPAQVAPPQIATDHTRHLHITWANDDTRANASYQFMTTR